MGRTKVTEDNLPDKKPNSRTLVAKYRWQALGSLVVIGILVGGYFVFHWRENRGYHPAYGDVATWLTFLAATVGIPFALYQFADQRQAIKGEFARQRERDELLAGQLKQVDLANRMSIRRQAEGVDFRPDTWRPVKGQDGKGQPIFAAEQYLARITNASKRPIRDVSCVIFNEDTGVRGSVNQLFACVNGALDPRAGESVGTIRTSEQYGFGFADLCNQDRIQMTVSFTDDAGIKWRLDQDLHLEQDGGG
jgi:hypothetical protein